MEELRQRIKVVISSNNNFSDEKYREVLLDEVMGLIDRHNQEVEYSKNNAKKETCNECRHNMKAGDEYPCKECIQNDNYCDQFEEE